MSAARRLVIVDDEPGICGLVSEFMARNGFSVTACASGKELDAALSESTPDIVLLDLALPGEDGLSIARRLRAEGDMPIIMLSTATQVVDRIVGLEVGADDYVPKPFDLHELRARVHAVLRRSGSSSEPPEKPATPRLIPFGRVSVDLEGHALVSGDGSCSRLTATEFAMIEAFVRNPNRVLSRERLLDITSGRNFDVFDRSIDLRVTRLRRKVEVDPARPEVIQTVHGTGYVFVPAARRTNGDTLQ